MLTHLHDLRQKRGLYVFVWSLLVLALTVAHEPARAQTESYPAVYELDEWSLDWSPIEGLTVEAHRIVRVNRQAGSEVGRIRIWDTFFQRLKEFEGEVRDTAGRVLFSVGLEDVRSIAPFLEFRLYSGDVVRAVDLTAPQPPYTIEARWKVEIDNPFFWPDWVLGDHYPREHAVYRVALPKGKEIRYRQKHPGLAQSLDRTARRRVITWELRDWLPVEDTDAAAGGTYPLLYVAPAEFHVGRNKGRTDTWEALGKWYWSLTRESLNLRKHQKHEVDRYLQDYYGERASAAALKDWVSDRWRYVAIEVGLGGWRPHPAREVFDNRYGDCKDVVFLWVAMMRQAGLDAYPALIRARDPLPIDADFPKDWFDHVVGVAMINGDTLWADPSDSRYPLGSLPPRCESRWALVVGEFGGRLMRTPARDARENHLATHTEGTLDSAGNLAFRTRMVISGHFARRLPVHRELEPRMAAAVILGVAPTAIEGTLERFEVVATDSIIADLQGLITGWALADPDQIQMRPRLGGWVAADTLAGRPEPARVDFPETVYDTLIIHFPSGWTPELWPAAPFHSETAGEMGEVRTFAAGTLTIRRHARWEGSDRSETERRGAARLSRAFQRARDAEWLFRRIDGTQPTEHPLPQDSLSSPVEETGGFRSPDTTNEPGHGR